MTSAPPQPERDTDETFFGDAVTWRAEAARALGIADDELPAAISPGAAFPAVLRTIVTSMRPSPKTIVDVGSGVGGDAEFLRRATGATVYAVEPSDLARDTAQRCFPLLRQVAADAANTGLLDGSADAVVICGVLSLIDHPHPVLREATRLLAPGGRLAIADLFASGSADLHSDPNVFRTPDSVVSLCAVHGLEPIEVGVGEATPNPRWSDISARVETWIEEHCRDRPGFDAWCSDRAHRAQHIQNGDVLGGCLIFR